MRVYTNPKTEVDIENNFTFHPIKAEFDQATKYEMIRAKQKELAHLINKLCPDSREKSRALTALEDVGYNANASIARHE